MFNFTAFALDFLIRVSASLLSIVIVIFLLFLITRKKINKNDSSPIEKILDNPTFSPVTSDITFDDIAGIDEIKSELVDILDFMKHPEQYQAIGAKLPRGIIFYGEPGTGKTLLAKALAKEANLPFYFISGSDFSEIFLGSGAKKIRALFAQARKTGGIIFIDEIDSVAGARLPSVSSAEPTQTLNQLLTEMDGFNSNDNIFVLAATNRLDSLDKAILRPGRLGRHIAVPLPGIKGRKEIIKSYLSKYQTADNIDVDSLANSTTGFAGADIANLINEAAIAAVKENKSKIKQSHIDYAWEKVVAGLPDSSKLINEETKYRIAVHEIGHAIAATELKTGKLEKISILPRSQGALGYNLIVPEDKYLLTKDDIVNQIATDMAGAMAEKLIFGNTSTGLHDDLAKATKIAKNAIAKWGMGKYLISVENPTDEKEISDFIDLGVLKAYKILESRKKFLLDESSNLLKSEIIDGSEFISKFFKELAPVV